MRFIAPNSYSEPSSPIPGGYILFARRFIELLTDMPLLDRTLWLWLYCKANHKDYPDGNLKRGELLTTIDEMRDAMAYRSGYRTVKPSEKEIRRALGRLHGRNTVVLRKTTRGLVITICDYACYQNPSNYGYPDGRAMGVSTEGQEGAHYKQECNKNDKNKEGGKPPNFSSKPVYLKTFDELARERADAAFERAARRFLENEEN